MYLRTPERALAGSPAVALSICRFRASLASVSGRPEISHTHLPFATKEKPASQQVTCADARTAAMKSWPEER